MYPSDYEYAGNFQSSTGMNDHANGSVWLYSLRGVTFSPMSGTFLAGVADVNVDGRIYAAECETKFRIFPALFLNSTKMIKSGNTGSSTDPYQLKA